MTQDEFEAAIKQAGRTSLAMRRALYDIVMRNMPWRRASIEHGVTESGIMRAMRRARLGRYANTRLGADLQAVFHGRNINP